MRWTSWVLLLAAGCTMGQPTREERLDRRIATLESEHEALAQRVRELELGAVARRAAESGIDGHPEAAELHGGDPTDRETPALALDGFCPVTLIEQARWQPGDKRFGVVLRGRLYLFAGDGEKQRFSRDPDRFAPILSGNDPVEFSESGRLTPGKRRHGVFFRNRIYLFASEESLERFWTSPQRYADTAREAMDRSNKR